jgi:Glycosyl hydrolase-like 10
MEAGNAISRRTFLGAALAGPPMVLAAGHAAAQPESAMDLSEEHRETVNRRRRITVQFDAHTELGADFDRWLAYRFNYIDEPGSQIDSVWWDIGALGYATYPSKVLQPFEHEGLLKWQGQGIDWVARLVDACHTRGLETFWHHRISEVEIVTKGVGADRKNPHPLKQAHPDWVLDTWWNHGLWNLANPEVRDYKVRLLREVAENYDFDGMQLDFARHIPCLPPGRQWELRDCVTDLLRRLRTMLLEVERKRGRPFLLAAKVPRNLEGCKADGFDVEAWAREGLVDILTLGTRSMDVDIPAFRRVVGNRDIKLQPCFDDHHTSDAYQYAPVEFLRGVFANWWQQGADSVYTFNWSCAAPDACKAMGALSGPPSHRQAYHEIGEPATLELRDKVYAVERRGGYPWAEGYFGRNDDAPLPAMLSNDGKAASLNVYMGDDVKVHTDKVRAVILRLILFGASENDTFRAQFNRSELAQIVCDPEWRDKLIFSPKPQPPSGGADHYSIDLNQRLLRLDYTVDAALCRQGANEVVVSVDASGTKQAGDDIKLEKVEVHVDYL